MRWMLKRWVLKWWIHNIGLSETEHVLRMTWKCGTHDVVVTRFLRQCMLQNEVDAEEVDAEVVDSQHQPVRNSGWLMSGYNNHVFDQCFRCFHNLYFNFLLLASTSRMYGCFNLSCSKRYIWLIKHHRYDIDIFNHIEQCYMNSWNHVGVGHHSGNTHGIATSWVAGWKSIWEERSL